MAKKARIQVPKNDTETHEVNGYVINDLVGLYQGETTKLWRGVHLRTSKFLDGPSGTWKQKRQCLAYLESLISQGMNFVVDSETEFWDKNPDGADMYQEAVKFGKGA